MSFNLLKYCKLNRRMPRSEYFTFGALMLLIFLVSQVLIFTSFSVGVFTSSSSGDMAGTLAAIGTGSINMGLVISELVIFSFVLFFYTTTTVQRLHDMGKSGLWMLLCLAPMGEWIILVFTFMNSEEKANNWGEPPYGTASY